MSRRDETLLMFADSERDADMLYAVGAFIPDPLIYLRVNGRAHLVVSDLECDRLRAQVPHCRVLSLQRLAAQVKKSGTRRPTTAAVIRELLRQRRLKRLFVPTDFPHGLARQLRQLGVRVKLQPGPVFPQREVKSLDEVKKISAALMMAEVGLSEAIHVLKNSKIGRDGRLIHHHLPLRAEKLRAVINIAILQAGGVPGRTIVAGGRQACDPHEAGRGVLRANETIVIDVFPRSQKTGYHGDITRTVVRGRASEAVRQMYHTVLGAQEIGLAHLADGTPAAKVHEQVAGFIQRHGYKTGRKNGRMIGFFHGTGHGLGLDVHEAPRLNAVSEDVLSVGNIVTIEPGLYYPAHGGVRLEDVALVTANGARNLTKFEKVLEV
jgi:Xaa-Pro aminopeptidase